MVIPINSTFGRQDDLKLKNVELQCYKEYPKEHF